MSSHNNLVSIDDVADVLDRVRQKGVRVWLEDGQLRYKAPKNALTDQEIARLRGSKEQVVTFLRQARSRVTDLAREDIAGLNVAPLTFSQLQHWNFYQLGDHRALRHLAAATRLLGRLNIDALRKAVAELVRTQDALRTRFVIYDGVPMQQIAESGDWDLKVDDLTTVSGTRLESEMSRRIEQVIRHPIDVTVGPLFEVRLLRLTENENVLIVALEHIIADMWSLNLFLRDLFIGYAQVLKGYGFSLPKVSVQFADFAVWQRSHQAAWHAKHGAYWKERLSGCGRLGFPNDADKPVGAAPTGWAMVPVQVGGALSAELREWCRLRRSTTVMGIFTAYVALVMRWCNVSDTVIRFEGNGRISQRIENTIGYFTAPLYLRIALFEDDRFDDLLNRIKDEYCMALEHADSSYLEAQLPRPEFTRNTAFNWVSRGAKTGPSELDGTTDEIACSPFPFSNPFLSDLERDTEPFILFGEDAMHTLAQSGEPGSGSGHLTGTLNEVIQSRESAAHSDPERGIVAGVYFLRSRLSIATMERFARNFVTFAEALVRNPHRRVKDIALSN